MSQKPRYIPLEQRDPATVRAVILARSSDTAAKAEDMESQVRQCQEFIKKMEWPPVTPDHILTEAATGMRRVARPVIDQLMEMIHRDEIDVVVCREFERVARSDGRRKQIIGNAGEYGVEFRFANIPDTKGKMPDDPMARAYQVFTEWQAEAEAEKIAERLGTPKRLRLEDGYPQAGRGGAKSGLYGYTAGERRIGKHGNPAGMTSFAIHEERAEHVRWLYRTVDVANTAEVNLDGLARQLDARGAQTTTGRPWSHQSVRNILANPKYAGLGRNGRFWSEWVQKKDPDTGRVSEHQVIHDRLRELDEETYLRETFPVAASAYPPIIDEALFVRVQAKLKAATALHYRGGVQSEHGIENPTLLNGRYVRCAECGGLMIRCWQDNRNAVHYLCRRRENHTKFSMRARMVDDLALRLLARAIDDPEQLLELAAAAEEHYPEAETTASLAEVDDITYKKRLAKLDEGISNHTQVLQTLATVSGTDDQINGVRERLEQLRAERAEVETEHTQQASHHRHAVDRRDFLQRLFTVRSQILNLNTGEVTSGAELLQVGSPGFRLGPDGKPVRFARLTLSQAAALLSIPEADVAALMPVELEQVMSYKNGDSAEATDTFAATVDQADVLYFLLTRQSRERLRRLLYNLDAVVVVKRGYSREEYRRRRKAMPPKRRVLLQVYGAVELSFDQDDDDGDDGSDGPGGTSPQGPCHRTEG